MEPVLSNEQGQTLTAKNKTAWQAWWRLFRPHTLTASFVPVLVGTAAALPAGSLDWSLFLAMLLSCILIQTATNMFNEYYDYKRGLDTRESVGIGGAIVRDGMAARTVLGAALLFYSLSVVLGTYICLKSSFWIAAVGVVCMAVGYFYTGGPYPIAYTPFGEIFAGFFMGSVIILISFYIQTGYLNSRSILLSVPIAILIGAILMANNIRDLDGDKKSGRRTLAILLGRDKAIWFLAGMFMLAYLWIFFLMITGQEAPWLLVVLASVPKAVKAVINFRDKLKPAEMMPAMKNTAETNTQFGLLMSLALLLSFWF